MFFLMTKAVSQTRMLDWINYRVTVLDELVRHDGLQGHTSPPLCSNCLEESGVYRCLDCSTIPSYCSACLVFLHNALPLHRIEVCSYAFNSFPFLMFSTDVVRRILLQDITFYAGLSLSHRSSKHALSIPKFQFPEDPRHRPQWSALHQCPVLCLQG